ncbi:TRADD-N-associated membrane domain-containing protein [Vibrio sp. OPT20]|uniref:TRADD-N-associated membrane domain-containing protein n=1 Tax=Vibrio sp. OPT20 TaxID=2778642 RepID=UPI0018818CB4|nr:hypothetical protein [Vibrio sp. OPT20]MBE8564721.1 hypothetical protein [Vibrio sp. OPT20]
MINNLFIVEFFTQILAAYKGGNDFIKRLVVGGVVLICAGIIFQLFGSFFIEDSKLVETISSTLAIPGAIFLFGVFVYQNADEQSKKKERYVEVEERVKSNPNETQAAWDLARIKLESYIDRNLRQVRSIYFLTLIVMLVGFSLIGFGIYTVILNPSDLYAGVLSCASGVLVNFLGATFLVIYKSTMTQASDYVSMLERINAVGMSVQVLEKLDSPDKDLKHRAMADLSQQLLQLYRKT